jgi:hypothetical protein
MEKKNSATQLIDDGVTDPMKQVPKTNFQRFILRSVIGEEKAQMVLTKTLGILP